jgi:hypothetical protein
MVNRAAPVVFALLFGLGDRAISRNVLTRLRVEDASNVEFHSIAL